MIRSRGKTRGNQQDARDACAAAPPPLPPPPLPPLPPPPSSDGFRSVLRWKSSPVVAITAAVTLLAVHEAALLSRARARALR